MGTGIIVSQKADAKPSGYRVQTKKRSRARSPEDAKELIEVGFEFVDEINGKHLYRKQKVRVK